MTTNRSTLWTPLSVAPKYQTYSRSKKCDTCAGYGRIYSISGGRRLRSSAVLRCSSSVFRSRMEFN